MFFKCCTCLVTFVKMFLHFACVVPICIRISPGHRTFLLLVWILLKDLFSPELSALYIVITASPQNTFLYWAPNIFNHSRSNCISPERNILLYLTTGRAGNRKPDDVSKAGMSQRWEAKQLVRTYCISLFRRDGSSTRSAGCEIGTTLSREERWEERQREADV